MMKKKNSEIGKFETPMALFLKVNQKFFAFRQQFGVSYSEWQRNLGSTLIYVYSWTIFPLLRKMFLTRYDNEPELCGEVKGVTRVD